MNSIKNRVNPPLLQTRLIPYSFDTSKTDQREAWEALKETLESKGYRCMESLSARSQDGHGVTGRNLAGEITLETAHLFDNQWNSTTHRVFDWALDARVNYGSPHYYRSGYYLEMTDEMRAIRAEVTKCGYCGAYGTVTDGPDFCTECYSSQYLEEKDLKLTRMRPINKTGFGPGTEFPEFPELTEAEQARLTLTYKAEQGVGNTARAIKRRATLGAQTQKKLEDALKKAEQDKVDAKTEFDAATWLLDHGIRNSIIENFIFYKHTGRFGFGWMRPLSVDETTELLGVIKDFPYAYDIKSVCSYEELMGSPK